MYSKKNFRSISQAEHVANAAVETSNVNADAAQYNVDDTVDRAIVDAGNQMMFDGKFPVNTLKKLYDIDFYLSVDDADKEC